MKLMGHVCIFTLCAGAVFAQLELPEYLPEEESGFEEEIRVPGARDGSHARPEDAEGGEAEEEVGEMLDARTRRLMQQMRLSAPRRHPMVAPVEQEDLPGITRELVGGPESVELWASPPEGEEVKWTLPNQTLVVETLTGGLPVRLHQLVRAVPEKEGEVVIELADGDLVRGRLRHPLRVKREDDRLGRVALEEWRALRATDGE